MGQQENKDQITYRCDECGSTDVQIQAWVKPNSNNEYAGDCEDLKSSWCDHCEQNVSVSLYDSFVAPADEWWDDEASGEDKEVVSGLSEDDFDSEEKYKESCDAVWNQKSDNEKIEIWIHITKRDE